MLEKKYRLTRSVEILKVLKKGRFVNEELVRLKYLLRKQKQEREISKQCTIQCVPVRENGVKQKYDDRVVLRIAVVVGKKILRRAVDRNRAKRLVRESVRLLLKEGKIKSGYDLIFLVQSEIVDKKQVCVAKKIKILLEKADLLI